ncbi:MAG: phospholipase D family protein [Rhodospirillales bacterium]|nr:phospholipase D family protein [Rhodospirillales bacterium]
MRYIDNGTGDPREEALFSWLEEALLGGVVGLRWQSGYFEASVLGLFMPTLQELMDEDLDTMILIGSNERETLSSAVHRLVDALGLPRTNAHLGVVSYSNGFFHPKTIHLCYRDGREVAYVGSANLTARGINGRNMEAGIILDTDDGDPVELLARIRRAPEEWFDQGPQGLFGVDSHEDVDQLERRGILATHRPPRRRHVEGGQADWDPLPRRRRRHRLPELADEVEIEDDDGEEEQAQEVELEGDVLIAELAGPGRWGQAAFPQWFIDNFFQVLPGTGDTLRLLPITEADGLGEEEERECGHKEGSRNWYYELGLATVVGAYPEQPPKPIGIFHRVGAQTCRYTILMPDNASYRPVADFLAENRNRLNRPRNELPRTIVPAVELRDAWPNNWFFDA